MYNKPRDIWYGEPALDNKEELELIKKTLQHQIEVNKYLIERIEKLERIVYNNGWESK